MAKKTLQNSEVAVVEYMSLVVDKMLAFQHLVRKFDEVVRALYLMYICFHNDVCEYESTFETEMFL